jgi:hypothetical protein
VYSFGQWLHQHDLLLLGLGIIAATGLLPLLRRRSPRAWLLWLGVTGLTLAGLFSLRTSNASVTEHDGPAPEALEAQLLYMEPDLKSVEAIEQLLADGKKPTLVEVYSDYGIG